MSEAEDAARYRWLRLQFSFSVEKREWLEQVGENSRGQLLSERRQEFFYQHTLKDDWRFCGTTPAEPAPNIDDVIDRLMKEYPDSGESEHG